MTSPDNDSSAASGNRPLTIEDSGVMEDWFVLSRDSGGACVEGTRQDWLDVLAGIEKGESGSPTDGYRCAAKKVPGGWIFYSPRNSSYGEGRDVVRLADGDGPAFVARCREGLSPAATPSCPGCEGARAERDAERTRREGHAEGLRSIREMLSRPDPDVARAVQWCSDSLSGYTETPARTQAQLQDALLDAEAALAAARDRCARLAEGLRPFADAVTFGTAAADADLLSLVGEETVLDALRVRDFRNAQRLLAPAGAEAPAPEKAPPQPTKPRCVATLFRHDGPLLRCDLDEDHGGFYGYASHQFTDEPTPPVIDALAPGRGEEKR